MSTDNYPEVPFYLHRLLKVVSGRNSVYLLDADFLAH